MDNETRGSVCWSPIFSVIINHSRSGKQEFREIKLKKYLRELSLLLTETKYRVVKFVATITKRTTQTIAMNSADNNDTRIFSQGGRKRRELNPTNAIVLDKQLSKFIGYILYF